MTPLIDLAGIVFGMLGAALGIALLIAQLRHAPMMQRAGVGLLVFLCLLVAIDGSVSLRTIFYDFSPSPIGVGFAVALSINWSYRLRRPPKMKGEP